MSCLSNAVEPGDLILAGNSFGIGSSREQAAEALKHLGISAIVARSLGGIFQRNALNLGLPALVCPELDLDNIKELAPVKLDLVAGKLDTVERQFATEALPNFLLTMIADGGMLSHLKLRNTQEGTIK